MQANQIKRGHEYQVPVLWPCGNGKRWRDHPPLRITVVSRSPSMGDGWFRVRFHNDGGVSVVHASRIEEVAA